MTPGRCSWRCMSLASRPSCVITKDGAGRPGASRSTGRPARESPRASCDNGTRTPAWRNGSRCERRAAPGLELRVGATTGGIQVPGQDVGLNSPVPLLSQKLLEPLREAAKLLSREPGDGGLKFFDAHKVAAYRNKAS